jgi:TonB family protein
MLALAAPAFAQAEPAPTPTAPSTILDITVGADGKPKACAVAVTSGTPDLDAKACDLAGARFSFTPSPNGSDRTERRRVMWRLEDVSAAPDTPPIPIPSSLQLRAGDYPHRALQAGQKGITKVGVKIAATGRVAACVVMESSGHPVLDQRTCQLAASRWRYQPATREGQPVESQDIRTFRWILS